MEQDRDFQLSNEQRDKLCEMMYFAFLEIRSLGGQGKAEQAADLADAFHNLPKDMWTDSFDLVEFRNLYLRPYQEKYSGQATRNYVDLVTDIILMGNPDYSGN